MPGTTLRAAIIRLAARRADLRPHLLSLLAPGSDPSPVPAPAVPPLGQTPAPAVPWPSPPAAIAPVSVNPGNGNAPVYFQSAPVIVLPGSGTQAPAALTAPPPVAALDPGDGVYITTRTQEGFDLNMAPEMTRMLSFGQTRKEVAQWAKMRVQEAFRKKDSLYMILIRYQSTFESDETYRLSFERAIDIWSVTGETLATPGV